MPKVVLFYCQTQYKVLATTSNDTVFNVVDLGNGSFTLAQNQKANNQVSNSNNNSDVKTYRIIKENDVIFKFEDSNIQPSNEKLIRVKENLFQKATEFSVNISNSNEVENLIKNYEVSPKLAEDLRNLSQQSAGKNFNVKVYLPFKTEKNNSPGYSIQGSTSYSYYYTGYAGEYYRDEVLIAYNYGNTKRITSGSTVVQHLTTTLYNLAQFAISQAYPKAGALYSLVGIINGLLPTYTPSTSDFWEGYTYEQKTRIYTSIYWNYLGYPGWYFRAVSDKGSVELHHRLVINSAYPSQEKKGMKFDSATGDYYYDTDVKAYEFRNKPIEYFYNETLQSWKLIPFNETFYSFLQ